MGFQVELFPHRIPSDDAVPRHDVSQRSLRVPDVDPVNWQPLSQMPLIASMIDGALNDTRTHVGTLNEAQAHVLDNATIDRIERVHNEQMKFVDIYDQQVRRWRTQKLLPDGTASDVISLNTSPMDELRRFVGWASPCRSPLAPI